MNTRATLIAAPSSHQGKTVYTAALARHYINNGYSVRILKVGPDYLDPMLLEAASKQPVLNLDWWMMGEQQCRQLYYNACRNADIVLVESLMGLHDNTPSNAWLANSLSLPVTLIINMAKFAQTSAAVVHGMCSYDIPFTLHGVVGNRLGSQHHHTLVTEALENQCRYLGSLRRDDYMILPERHLGIVQAEEINNLDQRLDEIACCLKTYDIDTDLPVVKPIKPIVDNSLPVAQISNFLQGSRIAIARDAAFSFIYPENIRLLSNMGAKIEFFSPLAGEPVPDCDALWLPGGYPELHLNSLSSQQLFLESVYNHIYSKKPTLAECGGMMVLGKTITDINGVSYSMCNAISNRFEMTRRFQSIGYQQLTIDNQTIRGHSFHHSKMLGEFSHLQRCKTADGNNGECFFDNGGLRMGYLHLYFPSNPQLTARLFSY